MKILDVILKEEAILQGTNWTKNWLDWDELPAEVVRNNPAAYADVKPLADPVQAAKAKLDAWRRANPGKFPAEAWTYLGGKGPIPTPSKTMPGRDLRSQPPDDSGTWIDSGTSWTHTIPPFIFAIKPDNRNQGTWGPAGGNTSYMPVEDKIKELRKGNANITDQEIEAKLRELPGTGTVGGKMYSNREIADGIRNEKSIFAFNNKEKADKEEAKAQRKKEQAEQKKEREAYKQAQEQFKKNKTCPIGFEINDDETGCVRDPDAELPQGSDPAAPVATPTPTGNVSMIWPAGNRKTISDKYGSRDGTHHGIDIALPYGSDVVAPEDGKIIEQDIQVGLAGMYMKLQSKDGNRVHTFMHLSVPSRQGTVVKQGQKIAESGGIKKEKIKDGKVIRTKDEDERAGKSSGPHLHWELTIDGKTVNPLDYVE